MLQKGEKYEFKCVTAVCSSAAETFTDGIFTYSVDSKGRATIKGISADVEGEVIIPDTIGEFPVVGFYETFKGNNKITSVIIPEGVSSISYYAFYRCENLEYVYIPSTLTYVGREAFCNTESLKTIEVNADNSKYLSENGILYNKDKTEILVCPSACGIETFVFPDSVTKIGAYCFYLNASIKEVIMPENLTEIGEYAFYNSSVEKVSFNDNLFEIKKCAFSTCKKLQSFELPSSLEIIGDFAFETCHAITELSIPDGVRTIGKEAFNNCDTLINIEVGSTAESIGAKALGDCNKLQSIYVSDSNQYYSSDENGIFYDKNKTILFTAPACNGITEYIMPDSVTVINEQAFVYHQTLTTVAFSESLKEISDKAFFSCGKLEGELFIPAFVENIAQDAFYACYLISCYTVSEDNEHYASDAYGAIYDKNFTELILYPPASEKTEYVIPSTVTIIKEDAVSDANNLRKITIPDNVSIMEEYAIVRCDNLDEITIGKGLASVSGRVFPYCSIGNISVSDENEFFCSVDGVLYSKDMTILYKYPSRKTDENYVIGDTVKTVYGGAFVYAANLKNVIVPSNVSEIGYYAFQHCFGLKNLTIVNPAIVLSSYLLSTPNTTTTVYGYRNSTAEKLCNSKSFMFAPLADGLSIDFEDGVLIVSGAEELPVIDDEKINPWVALAPITECILVDDVSVINDATFSSFPDINSLILKSDSVTLDDGAFANCHKLRTVISFGDVAFSEEAFSAETADMLFFAEDGKNVSAYEKLITFSYYEDENGEKIVKLDGDVTIEHYDFFNLVVALCDRYKEVDKLEFTKLTLLNGNIEVDNGQGSEDRVAISSIENERLAVQILDEVLMDVKTISFDELCVGVAEGSIERFVLVVFNENNDIIQDAVVDSDQEKDEFSFVVMIFRALITFFNKILRLFR